MDYIQSSNILATTLLYIIGLMLITLLVRFLIKDFRWLDTVMWVLVIAVCCVSILDAVAFDEWKSLLVAVVAIGGKLIEPLISKRIERNKRQTVTTKR